MHHFTSKKTIVCLLLLFMLLGGFLRLYDINWGAPFYFHPDERNIASSISQLSFPDNLNPRFFAYGSLPIYTIYLLGIVSNFFSSCQFLTENCQIFNVKFEQAIIIGRILSAVLSILLIPLVYMIGRKLNGEVTGLVAAFLTTWSVGLIQYAHFATFELWTTFFAVVQLLLALLYIQKNPKVILYFLFLVTGVLISIKVSNIVLIPVAIIAFVLPLIRRENVKALTILKAIGLLVLLLMFTSFTFIVTNPFVLSQRQDFLGSIEYESAVALGTLDVFYTGEFHQTTPILFQSLKVFPFLLNPLVWITGIVSFFYIIYKTIKTRSSALFLLLFSFLLLFLSSSFMYVKWVRYMIPTLPFLYLIISFSLVDSYKSIRHHTIWRRIIIVLGIFFFFSSAIFSYAFFHTAYIEKDTRIDAVDFAINNIPPGSDIISEVYDMGIVPFNSHYTNITLFNFYDLDSQGEHVGIDLQNKLQSADYIILPSQRILATRLSQNEKFPIGFAFYNTLISDQTRFTKIYETPCSFFCQITYLENPINRYEGTATVFDRPHVMIFKIDNE